MAKTTRLAKSIVRLLFPAVLLIVLGMAGASVWLLANVARPPAAHYLVTPEKYGMLSSRGAQVTEETWANQDGTTSRGWLLRGADNAPGVILYHRYGADRSHVLDLGVKLSESTNFTVLMPDLRAHGEKPLIEAGSFGGLEAEDAVAAVKFLKDLKNQNQITLVGNDIGVYGVELGAMSAMGAATADSSIRSLALDSVPRDSDELAARTVGRRFPFASAVTSKLAKLGTYIYFYDGSYNRHSACETAKAVNGVNVLLLAGYDVPEFQESTTALAKCFPSNNKVDAKLDLSPSGFSVINASIDQSEAYDQRIIDFFRHTLGQQPL
jgi:pimeloyl-ACP methyl ester carboxylesterase